MVRFLAIMGFAFLYIPLAVLVIFSFNENERASVWTGFTTKWYGELFDNTELIDAALTSLQVAFFSASLGVIIGVFAAYVLVKYKKFRGRDMFGSMLAAPLVLPDIILGFSALTLFLFIENTLNIRNMRGVLTIILAYTTLCSAYVCVTVSSRLASMDQSLEEAAADLGAKPWQVFFQVTLPVIFPSVLAGWLLSFTLAMDDAVIVQFVTGAGATTLPVKIWSQVRMGVTPEYNALATIIILMVMIIVIAAMIVVNQMRKTQ